MSQDHYEESSRLKRNSKSNKTAGKFEPVTEMQKRFSVNSRQDSIGKRNSEENYLECPSCGWEDPSSFNDEENVRDEICCSYYASVFQKVMEKYKAIQQITGSRLQQQQQQCNNPVCSPSYFGDAPNRSRNDRKNVQNEHVEKIEWNDNKRSCSCTQTEEKAEKADKKTECNEEDCSKATALKIAPCNKGTIGVTPEIISKFEDGVLEAYSQFKVVLPKLVQAGEELAEKRSKNVQTCSNTKQQAVSTLKCLCLSKHIQCPSKHLLIDQKCDCKFQNTVSLSTTDLNLLLRTCLPCSLMHNVQRNAEINQCTQDAPKTYCAPCEAFKLFAERHNEEIQLNGAKIKVDKSNSCPRFHQDTVESSFVQCDNRNLGKNTVCIPPKDFVDIDKNPDSFVLLTPSGKFVPFVRRQTEAKEVLVPCENYKNAANDNVEMEEEHAAHGGVCTNVNEIGKGSPIITQVLLHCLDKMISLEKKTLAKSNRSEEKFCKPCKSGQKVFNTPESSLEALGCICSEEMEVERTTGILTKTFLEVVKRALDLDNKADSPLDCACNEGAYEIDFATVMNEIEKSAAKILTMATGLDLVINLLLNQNQLETNQDKAKTVHNKATFVQPENQDVGTNSNSLQRLFMKEATAQSNYNVVYDGRTQTDPKIIRESGILAKPDKTSFGTQKREPILVQVVNYKGKEKFKKPDKNLLIQDDLVRTPKQTAKTLKNIDLTEAKNWGNCCNKNLRVKCDNNCKDPHAYRKDSEKQMLSCQTFLNKNSKIPLCVGLHKYLSKNKDH
ncbi:uncharacterized protein [Prorops nasuta]|uniref:uncharacterized protein isoform X1 n=1 Tax=Prorops nasuta TaxID=863751 RepID=UPI0034CE41DF